MPREPSAIPLKLTESPVTISDMMRRGGVAVLLLLTLGCPDVTPSTPTKIGDDNTSSGPNSSSAPEQTTTPAVPNSSLHDAHPPTQKIDLEPAIEETRKTFTEYGLPVDWYASLTSDPEHDNSVLIMGVWTKIGPIVAARFQTRFGTVRKPASRVAAQEIQSDNPVFEELLYQVLRGSDHGPHVTFTPQQREPTYLVPGLKPEYLKKDGSVAFNDIKLAILGSLSTAETSADANVAKSITSNVEERSEVVGAWRTSEGLPEWGAKQIAWRPYIRVEFVEGERIVGNSVNKGGRRLALSTYAQIGYRDTPAGDFETVSLAGPYEETNYVPVFDPDRPVMRSQTKFGLTPIFNHCRQKELSYADLSSLNAELSAVQQQQYATRESAPASMIANPYWAYGAGTKGVLTEIHQRLDALLRKTD